MSLTSLSVLESSVDQILQEADCTDADIAEAVQAVVWTQSLTPPFDEQKQWGDTLYALGWWLYIRAPAMDPRFLVISSMALDLVTSGDLEFVDVLENLEQLETDADSKTPSLQAYKQVMEAVDEETIDDLMTPLRENARSVARMDSPARADFEAALARCASHLLENLDAFQTIRKHVTNNFVDSFDELVRAEAFEKALHSPSGEHDHDHSDEYPELQTAAEYLERGQNRYAAGDLTGAIDDFSEAIELEPESLKALTNRGIGRAAFNDLDGAISDFSKALRIDPTHLPALLNRGLAHQAREAYSEAIEDFTEALQLEGEHPEAVINRGIAHFSTGHRSQALQDFDTAVDLQPDQPGPFLNRAKARQAGGDLEGAIQDYERAIELDPECAEAWEGLGYIRLSRDSPEDAIDAFDEAIELRPYIASLYYNRASAYVRLEDYEQAVDDYSSALELDPEDRESYVNRGQARFENRDFEGALEDWNDAIEVDPYYPVPYLKRAALWHMLDEPQEAAQDALQAVECAPPDWDYRPAADQLLEDLAEELGYDPEKTN